MQQPFVAGGQDILKTFKIGRMFFDLNKLSGVAADWKDWKNELVDHCAMLRPDLVIVDVKMPQFDGIDAIRDISKDKPSRQLSFRVTTTPRHFGVLRRTMSSPI